LFSHVFTSVTDFDRAFAFYAPLLASLGLELRFNEPERPWAGWHGANRGRPLFVICRPHDGLPHHPGNGQMVAFEARTRELVRIVHGVGLAHGGTSEGSPGLRPYYHPDYYGAYLRDPEGNKVGIACHAAEG
jgi:catechol 2,3-dioxygenase-like lactoylglutathione lyase family enzyme